MSRIHPRDLKKPYDVQQVKQCVESWRGKGIPENKVPVEVKVLASMLDNIETLATYASRQAAIRMATEEVLEFKRVRDAEHAQREAKRLENWEQDVKDRAARNRLNATWEGVLEAAAKENSNGQAKQQEAAAAEGTAGESGHEVRERSAQVERVPAEARAGDIARRRPNG